VGLGKSGLAACRLLHQIGCRVLATDCSETPALQATAAELQACGIAQVELGCHSRPLAEDCQALVVSPGVPESAAPIRWALEDGIPILSEVELAFRFCAAPVVAMTKAPRDVRLPAAGTVLTRQHDGVEHRVTVLAAGFEYNGKPYRSLSKIASTITGTP
jgi:hypothetical protein